VILATCIVCGHRQRIKTVADKCDKCSTINWK
jgi:uridine phosphorylase